MFNRKIISELIKWKNGTANKALLIKGARQVGKTSVVRQFAKENYKNFIEINFEQMPWQNRHLMAILMPEASL